MQIRRTLIVILAAILVTWMYQYVFLSVNITTIALTYLLVALVAGTYGLLPGILASVLCSFLLNYYFLPPVQTLHIHNPQDLVAFAVFLITALTASRLSSSARRRSKESDRRREEVARLLELSRSIVSLPDPDTALPILAKQLVSTFSLRACFICLPDEKSQWNTVGSDPETPLPVTRSELEESYRSQKARAFGQPGAMTIAVPLKSADKTSGVLVCAAERLEEATIEAIAGLVALALERFRFLRQLGEAEAVKQSDQLKSAILASVSHDLRTPLTSILAAVDNLLSTDVEWNEGSRREFYTIIREEVDRLNRVVQNLLDMARIEAGECRPVLQWNSVPDMLADVIDRCREMLAHRQIKLEVPDRLPPVRFDERLISQALANLLENAARYSAAGTEIILGIELRDRELRIRVEDQGPGIPAEELPLVFKRFYRGRAAIQDRSGTGMGLAIARGIVEAHGGSVHVESPRGKGAVFTISVPVEVKSS